MAEALLAGVDGGASKTRAVVLRADGAVLGTATVQSASAYHREPEEAAAVVASAVRGALAAAGVGPAARLEPGTAPLTALGAGLAGADDPEVAQRLAAALRATGLAASVVLDHDAAAALAGGTGLAPGVVVVAGTGSVAFGRDAAGRRARAGGWGPLLDDEGSGYAIGRAVLRAAMRAYDGRGEATGLAEAVRERFGLDTLLHLKRAVRGIAIDEVAAVAPLAATAARAGDTVARAILVRAARGLAAMVVAVLRALDWIGRPCPLVTTGGVFEAADLIRGPMMEAVEAAGGQPVWHPSAFPPEIGAALLAAASADLDAAALVRRLSGRPATGNRA